MVVLLPTITGASGAEDVEREASASGTVAVATIDGEPITVAEFVDEIARRSHSAPGAFSDPDKRLEVLDEMVRFEVLAAAARHAGYAHDPEILRAVERLIVTKFKQEQLDPLLDGLSVGDDEVARYYRAHLADYTIPERVRVAMVFVEIRDGATEQQRAALADRAAEALTAARAQERESRSFGVLAKEYSDDRVSRYLGGDVGWVSKGQTSYRWDDAVVEAMFALEHLGDVSPIVYAADGLYLLKLTAREETRPRPLKQVVVESIDLEEEQAAQESPPRLPGY
jgi:parvulin-like peptidyl-prolyl isomerase